MIDPAGLDGIERVIRAIAITMMLFLVIDVVVLVAVMAWSKRTHRSRRGLVLVLTAVALISVEASSVIAYMTLTDNANEWGFALLFAAVAVVAARAVVRSPAEASP